MSKKILIAIGSPTILLLLGAWVYLFLFGTPESVGQALNNLNSPETPFDQPIVGSLDTTVAVGNNNLAQLTTRPVAGFVLVNTGSQPTIRYAEKGTGHIYEINVISGAEERLDGTTSANTTEAYFSKDGAEAVLVLADSTERSVVWRTAIGSGNSVPLSSNSHDFSWNEAGALRYTERTTTGTTAYENNGENLQLWSIPLSDVSVFFTENSAFVANNPAARLSGSLYEIQDGNLAKVIGPAYSFTGLPDPDGQFLLYRYFDTENQANVAKIKDLFTDEETIVPLSSVPEKCAFNSVRRRVWCASSFMFLGQDREYLNKWYRGEVVSADRIWTSDYGNWGVSSLEIDLSDAAGFDIDVIDMTVSDDGTMLLFRNKINDALWMYRLSEAPLEESEETITETEAAATTTDAF